MLSDYMYRHAIGLMDLFNDLQTMQGNSDKGNFPPHRVTDIEDKTYYLESVSYTHLTLPTTIEV